MTHSKPRLIRVGGSMTNSPALTEFTGALDSRWTLSTDPALAACPVAAAGRHRTRPRPRPRPRPPHNAPRAKYISELLHRLPVDPRGLERRERHALRGIELAHDHEVVPGALEEI